MKLERSRRAGTAPSGMNVFPAEMILLIDEVDLPWGMLRIASPAWAAAHNRFRSVLRSLGTDEFSSAYGWDASRSIRWVTARLRLNPMPQARAGEIAAARW